MTQLVLQLNERFVMSSETLFNRGDGATELLWCVSGTLQVKKADVHITSIRSDLGDGQIVGEVAFFIGIQQPVRARAPGSRAAAECFGARLGSRSERASARSPAGSLTRAPPAFLSSSHAARFPPLPLLASRLPLPSPSPATSAEQYTVGATASGDVTLLVVEATTFETIMVSYPEQGDMITRNLLRRYGLDKNGVDIGVEGAGGNDSGYMDDDEMKEFEELKGVIRQAIVDRNEATRAMMTFAASNGDIETVRSIASRGLDLNVGGYDARTTLRECCCLPCVVCVCVCCV
jgi:CRP-like cAMP-binding protein